MKTAMFPGSFDPLTLGHLDIIKRASEIFDKLYVVVSNNSNKKNLFTAEQRMSILKEVLKEYSNVEVEIWNGLTVDFAESKNIKVIIRGIRSALDYEYELQIAETNKMISPKTETLFILSDSKYSVISSSIVKELASFGADISQMVPKEVKDALNYKEKA